MIIKYSNTKIKYSNTKNIKKMDGQEEMTKTAGHILRAMCFAPVNMEKIQDIYSHVHKTNIFGASGET